MQTTPPAADPPARKGPTARVAAALLATLLLVALPAQAMVMTWEPLLQIYTTGEGGGGGTGLDRPAWLTSSPGRAPVAPVEGGTDLTYGYDDRVLRDWRTDGTDAERRTVEDNVARIDIDATVTTSLQGEREGEDVTNALHNKLAAKLDVTPGHGWFLHMHRTGSGHIGGPGDWMAADMDLDAEDVLVDTTYTCYDWSGALALDGGYRFNLRAEGSGFSQGALRLEWQVAGTGLDAFPSLDPRTPAQRNDVLNIDVKVHDPDNLYGSCTASARFLVDLLFVHEWYEPLSRTVCQYTLGYFATENYHYSTVIDVVFARQSGTGATQDWAGESQTVSVLYLPILHQQLVVHNLPASETQALEQTANGASGTVKRLGVQAPPDGDVMYIIGQTGVLGGKLSGIYHQTGGPGKSQCYQVTDPPLMASA